MDIFVSCFAARSEIRRNQARGTQSGGGAEAGSFWGGANFDGSTAITTSKRVGGVAAGADTGGGALSSLARARDEIVAAQFAEQRIIRLRAAVRTMCRIRSRRVMRGVPHVHVLRGQRRAGDLRAAFRAVILIVRLANLWDR